MEVSDFVDKTMRALAASQKEVVVGMARALKVGSRLAPNLFVSLVNRPQSA